MRFSACVFFQETSPTVHSRLKQCMYIVINIYFVVYGLVFT